MDQGGPFGRQSGADLKPLQAALIFRAFFLDKASRLNEWKVSAILVIA